jgi:hypothetical protein
MDHNKKVKNLHVLYRNPFILHYFLLLGFKQKHGHMKVPEQCNENPHFGIWLSAWRNNYREYKRTNGQKGDPERIKHLQSIGLFDNILSRKHEDQEDKLY